MAHKPRSEMIAETRAKMVAAARHAFGEVTFVYHLRWRGADAWRVGFQISLHA